MVYAQIVNKEILSRSQFDIPLISWPFLRLIA